MTQWISPRTAFCVLTAAVLWTAPFAGGNCCALAQGSDDSLGKKMDLSLYGYVAASYTQNLNNPSDGINQYRSFDGDANSFRPNMAQIVLERVAKTEGDLKNRAGFRVKLNVGEDAKFTGGGETGEDEFDFQEAYVQYIAPIGSGVTFQAGRMNTLIGYEVIESPLNPNFSRSFLFGIGEPFTVTGLRASYDLSDRVSLAVSAINSFTGLQADDNNSKSVEALLSVATMDNATLSLFAFWGPEGPQAEVRNSPEVDNADRVQVGGIFDWQLTSNLEFVVEGYYGNYANAFTDAYFQDGKTNAQWGGVAGYVLYDLSEQLSLHVRTEYFRDGSGFFTCGVPDGELSFSTCDSEREDPSSGNALRSAEDWVASGGYDSGAQNLWEMTATLQFTPVDDLITRLEYRYDKSNRHSFQNGAGFGNNQSTVAVEAIYLF